MYVGRNNLKRVIFWITIQQISCKLILSTNSLSYSNVSSETDLPTHKRVVRSLGKCDDELSVNSLYAREECTMSQEDAGIVPTIHESIIVENFGISTIYADFLLGNKLVWFQSHPQSDYILPGNQKSFNDLQSHYVTGIKIRNMNKSRALFYAARKDYHPETFTNMKRTAMLPYLKYDRDSMILLLDIVGKRGETDKYKSYASMVNIVKHFWPNERAANWEPILNVISRFLTKKTIKDIRQLIEFHSDPVEMAMKSIVKAGPRCDCIKQDIRDLLDLIHNRDLNFVFNAHYVEYEKLNYYTLPVFSRMVNVMMAIYVSAITYRKTYDLKDYDMYTINERMKYILSFAETYINNLNKYRIRHEYKTGDPEFMYDALMNVRTYIAVNGLEYLNFWKYTCNLDRNKLGYVTLAYSEAFGRTTVSLNRHMLRINPALQSPIFTDNNRSVIKRKEIRALDFKLGWDNKDTLVGIDVIYYENHQIIPRKGFRRIRLNATIKALKAGGNGMVDYLTFKLSNGEHFTVGKNYQLNLRKPFKVFELKHHHIAGIFTATDCPGMGQQICNVAVSYALNDIYPS